MDTTRAGTLLGLPAFHVELRYRTDQRDSEGRPIEAVNLRHDYVERPLANAEFRRLFRQMGLPPRDGRWHLVLTDADGTILKEYTR